MNFVIGQVFEGRMYGMECRVTITKVNKTCVKFTHGYAVTDTETRDITSHSCSFTEMANSTSAMRLVNSKQESFKDLYTKLSE
jgi:hypothetical protein